MTLKSIRLKAVFHKAEDFHTEMVMPSHLCILKQSNMIDLKQHTLGNSCKYSLYKIPKLNCGMSSSNVLLPSSGFLYRIADFRGKNNFKIYLKHIYVL